MTDGGSLTARERHVERVKHLLDEHGVSLTPDAGADWRLLGPIASYHAGLHFPPASSWAADPPHDHDPDELAADLPHSVRTFVDGARGADFTHGG